MRRRKGLTVLAAVLCLLLASTLAMGYVVHKAERLSVTTPELSALSDGDYAGAYAIPPVRVEVTVSVRAHRIAEVTITRHENGLGGAAEALVDAVVAAQSPEVDAVSGATVSSKCIMKAIENALTEQGGE